MKFLLDHDVLGEVAHLLLKNAVKFEPMLKKHLENPNQAAKYLTADARVRRSSALSSASSTSSANS